MTLLLVKTKLAPPAPHTTGAVRHTAPFDACRGDRDGGHDHPRLAIANAVPSTPRGHLDTPALESPAAAGSRAGSRAAGWPRVRARATVAAMSHAERGFRRTWIDHT